MSSHRSRTAAVACITASALAVATMAPGLAAAAPPGGVGSSSGSTSLLHVVLGNDALSLRLLGEDAATSTDTAAGGPSALERVTPLQVSSALVPALSSISQPTVETNSTSGEDAASSPGTDLGALLASGPLPGLLSGTVDPATIRSAVDANGAVSSAIGAIRNVSVLGGLLKTGTASADLGSSALISDAGAVRGLRLDHLDVLNLGALLGALGISLDDLPIPAAVALLDQLGLPLPRGLTSAQLLATLDSLLAQTSAVRGQVTGLQDQISGARAQLASLTGQRATATALVSSLTSQLATQQSLLAACVVPALCAPIQALVDSLTAQLSSATSQVASLDALIAPLQAQIDGLLAQVAALLGTLGTDLGGLLDGILGGLADASLLSLDDLVVGVTARAGTTLASSVATVVGSVGAVRIGDQSLGGIDAGAASTQIAALSDQVTSAVGGVLAIIDPSLAGLVQIDVLDQARSVSESGGATHAMATITALRALITPPDVCGVVAGFGLQDTLGSVLGGLGQLPAPLAPISEVLGTIGSTVTCAAVSGATPLRALTQPTMVEALSISGAGSFSVLAAAAPGSPGELPATGGDGRLAMLAVVMLAAGLASRRLLGRAA